MFAPDGCSCPLMSPHAQTLSASFAPEPGIDAAAPGDRRTQCFADVRDIRRLGRCVAWNFPDCARPIDFRLPNSDHFARSTNCKDQKAERLCSGAISVGQLSWRAASSLIRASLRETSLSEPRPRQRSLPLIRYREVQFRDIGPATTRYRPSPSGYFPGVTRRATFRGLSS